MPALGVLRWPRSGTGHPVFVDGNYPQSILGVPAAQHQRAAYIRTNLEVVAPLSMQAPTQEEWPALLDNVPQQQHTAPAAPALQPEAQPSQPALLQPPLPPPRPPSATPTIQPQAKQPPQPGRQMQQPLSGAVAVTAQGNEHDHMPSEVKHAAAKPEMAKMEAPERFYYLFMPRPQPRSQIGR